MVLRRHFVPGAQYRYQYGYQYDLYSAKIVWSMQTDNKEKDSQAVVWVSFPPARLPRQSSKT